VTVYDRYLLRSYAWILVVVFVSTFGLFCVIDLMDNFDDFWTNNEGGSTLQLALKIGTYYGHFAFFFFDGAGRPLAIMAAMTLLILIERGGELKPLLAAGVPTYRLALPLIVAAIGVNALYIANRELVIPRIAHLKYAGRGKERTTEHSVETVYDHESLILIDGTTLNPDSRTVNRPQFVLPSPEVVEELTTIDGSTATFFPATANRPSGWLVRGASPTFEKLSLTARGQGYVRPLTDAPDQLFVQSSVSCGDLYKRSENATMLSTPGLIRRIQNPSFSLILARSLVLHFHERMVAPAINVACILCVIPLIIRRNSTGLVANSALCLAVLTLLLGGQQALSMAGQINLVSPVFAAWGPLVMCGATFAWISDLVQT
jgi:lipopolysaccharide export system permease protein